MNKTDLLIWWLDKEDCEAVEILFSKSYQTGLPLYLLDTFRSCSVHGIYNGCTWAHSSLPDNMVVDPWPTHAIGDLLRETSLGIVFRKKELQVVRQFPGLITDFQLVPVNLVNGDPIV